MREFEKTDWYGFSGAEADAWHPAMIGENEEAIIVVDLTGVAVYFDNETCFFLEANYDDALELAESIEGEFDLTPQKLIDLGLART